MQKMGTSYHRCLMTVTRNVVTFTHNRNSITVSPVTAQLTCLKALHNNSSSVEPVKLAYYSYDSATMSNKAQREPIVIMHGLFGSKNNWGSLSKAIHQRTERKVLTVDARNHGDSPHSSEMSYKHMAQDIIQLLNDLQLERAILVGHSMGGSTMMYLSLTHPELVKKLIVVDMSPVRTSPNLFTLKIIFQAMNSVTLDKSVSLVQMRKLANEQLAQIIKSSTLRQFLLTNLVEVDSGKYKWRLNLPVLERNFPTQIAVFPDVGAKVFTGPTLFIGGGNSDYILHQDHEAIKKLFPMAVFKYIDDANHWVHSDKPQEFLTVVTKFINESDL